MHAENCSVLHQQRAFLQRESAVSEKQFCKSLRKTVCIQIAPFNWAKFQYLNAQVIVQINGHKRTISKPLSKCDSEVLVENNVSIDRIRRK